MGEDGNTPIPGEAPQGSSPGAGTSPGSTPIQAEPTRPTNRAAVPGEATRVVQGSRGVPGERVRSVNKGAQDGEQTRDVP